MKMKDRTRHGEHVPYSDAHVHATERAMDFQIVRTVLQRSEIVTADLIADARRTF